MAIYVAFLSVAAIVTTIVIVSVAAAIFHQKNRRLVGEKQRAAAWERRLFDRLTDFLDGFKEVRLNRARSADLFDDAVDVSRTAANIKITTQAETFKMIVTSQISMYVLLGAVVFVAPQFSDTLGGAALTKTTTALMFIVGACFGLVQSIPILLNANAAADRIVQLENALRATVSSAQSREIPIAKRFDKIEMRKIMFPLRRQVFRGVPSRSDRSISPCGPASSFSLRAATVRANRRFCGSFPASIPLIPAKSSSMESTSMTIRATSIAR